MCKDKAHDAINMAKLIFLIALIDGVDRQVFKDNRFHFNSWLKWHYALMTDVTKDMANDTTREFTPLKYPFWHLQGEGFWHLHVKRHYRDPLGTPSELWLRFNVSFAELDTDLWKLLEDRESRQELHFFIFDRIIREPAS